MREGIGYGDHHELVVGDQVESFQGRYFPHRASVHRHGVSRRCDKRKLQPADDSDLGNVQGVYAHYALTTCISRR